MKPYDFVSPNTKMKVEGYKDAWRGNKIAKLFSPTLNDFPQISDLQIKISFAKY